MKITYAEYLWLDGAVPVQKLRSKTRVLEYMESASITNFPDWSFDGSSTNQATGDKSDCELKPVFVTNDPMRGDGHYIVLCEVFKSDGKPHPTNSRAEIRSIMENGGEKFDAYVGFEQEYTLLDGASPLGWPKDGYPGPQGPFYCGVGAANVFGREIVEEHMHVCSEANLCIYGTNAEVMPGQWEFQIGYRGIPGEKTNPLVIADHLWVARYFLQKVAERYNIAVSFDNKPVKGDWNGSGMHTNFSTEEMRSSKSGKAVIDAAIDALKKTHTKHINDYGHGLHERLTGLHETCSIKDFRAGVSDRGASIRIPISTAQKGCGYIEDRRPGANSDPYKVSSRLMETICNVSGS